MKYPIQKERIYLMCPCAVVCAIARLSRAVDETALRDAIRDAAEHWRILRAHVELAADGSAFLAEGDPPPIRLEAYACEPERLIARQERLPFDLPTGETVRFFFRQCDGYTELVVAAHHLVCDGNSLMLLMRSILLALNRQPLVSMPIRPLTDDELPARPKLRLPLRLMLGQTNRRWQKSGRAFTWQDLAAMRERYASAHENTLLRRTLDGRQLEALKQIARQQGVTLNSLLTAAFAAGLPANESVGLAVDKRPDGCGSMGNYALGVSVANACAPARTLAENAAAQHAAIRAKLDHPRELCFLHDFMHAVAPTLIDAIYFTRYGDYRNPVADAMRGMCGYVDAPKGVHVSNLTTVAMPDEPAWTYRYAALCFVPPYMPNSRGNIGVSTYGDTLTLTLHTEQNDRYDAIRALFENACDALGEAAKAL